MIRDELTHIINAFNIALYMMYMYFVTSVRQGKLICLTHVAVYTALSRLEIKSSNSLCNINISPILSVSSVYTYVLRACGWTARNKVPIVTNAKMLKNSKTIFFKWLGLLE